MTAKEKIQKYIDFKGITIYKLEGSAGLSNGYWAKTKSISADVLIKIARIYPDISAEWLLRGNGSMINPISASIKKDLESLSDSEHNEIIDRINSMPGDSDLILFYEQAIEEKDKEILRLRAENFMLKKKEQKNL